MATQTVKILQAAAAAAAAFPIATTNYQNIVCLYFGPLQEEEVAGESLQSGSARE